ncbi:MULTISPECIES: DUF1249 domain-containing protein [unclassified Colwellia]|uniref:DUF1249 domain-containing protein n=1 Tax=unclassified Colwellia TaxID=196834 RepID=UPI0015F48F1A|nr:MULTISPECIES: DUF1249 domain-containing protein [unclassified Colwellia]MBA6351560.1 DUF1249 domain-containing protein [Colwellia sp. BRX9-1]MBA6378201.1 DUF1249 domain-containing protein [Colwellia sp. BRX10-7]MBA6384381.1 DUF1249 domain-containing protein [Colwellia sp. BRX10-9]MBA6385540.1 DUF1249 domain-containing protein [Colwellia sp. BRX10-2]MBA6394693.1 DUF1249 domain-containing protein [Colwellia sp. BRX10-6]
MIQQSKKYQPRLSTLMNLCEVNYMFLVRLLASHNDEEAVGDERCFFISDFLSYKITILEITRYTSLVSIRQELPKTKAVVTGEDNNNKTVFDHILRPKMIIRLYHDARMAEVISNQDIKQVQPRYDYPNSKMHLPDEKEQINQFLKEWLQLCLKLGQVNLSLFE